MATTIAPETRVPSDSSLAVTTTPPVKEAPAIADPAPLGLAAFAVTTALLSGVNAGKITTGALVFVGMALAYGGIAQFAAGMWEFRKGNTFGATAFTSYAAFWLGIGFLFVFDVVGKAPAFAFGGTGAVWFFFVWAVFTTYMWITSWRTNAALVVTFALLTAALWALYIGAMHGDAFGKGFTGFGGWLGIVTAIAAGYTSFAGVINATFGRVVLPTYPMPALPASR
jgi:succinate-acetate transporter protein